MTLHLLVFALIFHFSLNFGPKSHGVFREKSEGLPLYIKARTPAYHIGIHVQTQTHTPFIPLPSLRKMKKYIYF